MSMYSKSIGPVAPALVLALALNSCAGKTPIGTPARDGEHQWVVNPPGVHPSLLFSKKELPKLRRRTMSAGLPGEASQRVRALASGDATVVDRSSIRDFFAFDKEK